MFTNPKTTVIGMITGFSTLVIPTLPHDYQALAAAIVALASAILGLVARDPKQPPTTPPSAVPAGV